MALTVCLSELIKNILGITAEILILKVLFNIKNNVNQLGIGLFSILFAVMSILPLLLFGNTDETKDIADIVTLLAFVFFSHFFFKSEKKSMLLWSGLIINATTDFLC